MKLSKFKLLYILNIKLYGSEIEQIFLN